MMHLSDADRPEGRPQHYRDFDYSKPPVRVPPQLEADVKIGIGADISAARVVHSVPILARGDALSFRGSECARSGGERENQRECGLGEDAMPPA
jgi:hypothetical protein